MKICILSMQKVPNIGSVLQSYALKKTLEFLGHEVNFIDIEFRAEDNALLNNRELLFDEEREGKSGFISKIHKIDKYTLNRILIRKKADLQNMKFIEFGQKELGLLKDDNDKQYDVCVIGSDEVFNCLSGAEWGFTSQLFGNVHQAKKVITYAASCGSTTYEALPATAIGKIKESFEKVSSFSVRDFNTERFINCLSEKTVKTHFDPVVITNFDSEISSWRNKRIIEGPFCIVYSYYNRIHEKCEIEAIKQFCKRNKWKIVSVGAPQMWIKEYPVLNPFEALVLFEQAQFVITDTFHGTIFAAKYAKQFATLIRNSNRNKLGDLMERLGLKSHEITDFNQLDTQEERFINDTKVMQVLQKDAFNKAIEYFKDEL